MVITRFPKRSDPLDLYIGTLVCLAGSLNRSHVNIVCNLNRMIHRITGGSAIALTPKRWT
jgi:hypothetical protein